MPLPSSRSSTDLQDAIAKTKQRLLRLERAHREETRQSHIDALLAAGKIVADAGLLDADPDRLAEILRLGDSASHVEHAPSRTGRCLPPSEDTP